MQLFVVDVSEFDNVSACMCSSTLCCYWCRNSFLAHIVWRFTLLCQWCLAESAGSEQLQLSILSSVCVCVCVLPGHQSKGWQLSVTSYVARKDLWQGHPVKILMFIYVIILPNCWCATRAVQWLQSCNAFLLKLFSVAQGLFCFTQTEDWFEILTGAARMFLANWTVPESVLKLGHQIIF